jgi:hypothetical protein
MFFNQFISTTNKIKKILFIKTFFTLFVFLITINFAPNAHADNKDLRFILTGHMYPILSDEIRLNNFLNKINSHNPDILFILGDSNLHKIDDLKKIKSKIKAKIFFSPGNQELLPENVDNYLSNIGYLNKTVIKNDIRFIILNSSEKKSNIINYLNENLRNDNKTNLILTHHRIWDDSIIDKESYSHDKSFYFEDIYPIINGKVKAIFAGNSKRQYFRDLNDHGGYGKQNVNLIYWMDKIGSIGLYSIGMGDGRPKATFTIVDIVDDKIIVNGDFSSTDEYDILPKNLIVYNEEKIDKNNIRRIREIVKDRYLLINKKKLQVTLTVLFFLILLFIFYKKLKKS